MYVGGDSPGRAAAFAAGSRAVYQRAGALFLVLARAAPADQATAELWRSAREARLADCRDLVRLASPSGTAGERTVDVVFVLSGPGVYADLTGDRGWPAASGRISRSGCRAANSVPTTWNGAPTEVQP